MLISTLDLKDKTIFHEINAPDNFNVFSVMDYSTNKMGVDQKINNGITSTLDYCRINDNLVLAGYVPSVIDKVVVKTLSINGTDIKAGPLYTLDERTTTNKISIIGLNDSTFIVCYNDNTNKCAKAIAIHIEDDRISTISNTLLLKGIVREIRAVKAEENEMAVFLQFDKIGIVQLIKFVDGNKLVKTEEQVFYTGSDLYNLTIASMHRYHVVGFLNSAHMLVLKILETSPKVKFTQGMQFNKRIVNDYFQLISIDNEMVLCYFNDIVQIISLNNGQIMQPEGI